MTLLIFDCDGVLVDSEVLAHETLLELMAPLGRPMTIDEAIREFAGAKPERHASRPSSGCWDGRFPDDIRQALRSAPA